MGKGSKTRSEVLEAVIIEPAALVVVIGTRTPVSWRVGMARTGIVAEVVITEPWALVVVIGATIEVVKAPRGADATGTRPFGPEKYPGVAVARGSKRKGDVACDRAATSGDAALLGTTRTGLAEEDIIREPAALVVVNPTMIELVITPGGADSAGEFGDPELGLGSDWKIRLEVLDVTMVEPRELTVVTGTRTPVVCGF